MGSTFLLCWEGLQGNSMKKLFIMALASLLISSSHAADSSFYKVISTNLVAGASLVISNGPPHFPSTRRKNVVQLTGVAGSFKPRAGSPSASFYRYHKKGSGYTNTLHIYDTGNVTNFFYGSDQWSGFVLEQGDFVHYSNNSSVVVSFQWLFESVK